jgi:hypothetical protein
VADLYPFGVDKMFMYICTDIKKAFRGLFVPTIEGDDDPIYIKEET